MKSKFRFLSLLSWLGKDKHASGPRLLARLLRDEEGAYLLIMTVAMPVFIGLAALATEGALIFYNHRNVQSAADSAAYSAAIAYSIDGDITKATTQAQAIVASYGFTVGTGNGLASVVVPAPDTTTYVDPITGLASIAINVTVTRPQLPILSSIWVNNPFSVSGRATAIISGGPGGNGSCVLSLAPTGTGIALSGNPAVDAPGCGIFSNSTSSPSISLSGSSSVTAGALGAAGSVSVGGSSNIGPPPNAYTSNNNQVLNPYTDVTTPAPSTATATGSCTSQNTNVSINGGTVTLAPGTYCHTGNNPAIDIKGGAIVTLSPAGTYNIIGDFSVKASTVRSATGTYTFTLNGGFNITNTSTVTLGAGNYTLKGTFNINTHSTVTLGAGTYTLTGSFNINASTVTLGAGTYIFSGPVQFTVDSQSTLTGIGVTLAFTDSGSAPYPNGPGGSPTAMNIQSGATIHLEAPTSGATQGFLIIGNRNIPNDTAFNLQANAAGTGVRGVVYLPTADMTWGGGPILAGGCTQMIAYRITMSGNATFDNSSCDASGGGGGGARPIGNIVTLVK